MSVVVQASPVKTQLCWPQNNNSCLALTQIPADSNPSTFVSLNTSFSDGDLSVWPNVCFVDLRLIQCSISDMNSSIQ